MTSVLLAPDSAGAVPPGHLTAGGQLTVRPPVASWLRKNVNVKTRPEAGTLVSESVVMFADIAITNTLLSEQLIVVVAVAVSVVRDSEIRVPRVLSPDTVSDDRVPTLVRDEDTTVEARVVPVRVPAAASTAVGVCHVPSPLRNVVLLAVPVPRRAAATVPVARLVAFRLVRLAPDTAPNEPDHVPEVTVPTEVREDVTTFAASVVPVRVPAAAAAAVGAAQVGAAAFPFEVST